MFLPFLMENIQNRRDSLWHVMGPPEGRVNVPSCHWSHRSNNKPMPFLMDTTKLKGRQWICQIRLHHCEGGLWVSWGLKGLNGLQCLLNFKKKEEKKRKHLYCLSFRFNWKVQWEVCFLPKCRWVSLSRRQSSVSRPFSAASSYRGGCQRGDINITNNARGLNALGYS